LSGIVWLASYPKSGNTWVRTFVANLRREDEQPADINRLRITIASNRRLFDDAAGVEASDLTSSEIARYRPRVYRSIAENTAFPIFLKIHDAYTLLPDGAPLIPADATTGAVYVIRNPLDVAVSFAHHSRKSRDETISKMSAHDAAFSSELPIRHLSQRLLSWSEHVSSWVDQQAFPVHVVKYEDMHARPFETFLEMARFCGLPCDPVRVGKAIENSSFSFLQRQEREQGFRETPLHAPAFFREGKVGGWLGILTESQVDRIVQDHGATMHRFGYLPL
jgi:aryl sulfotransferase